MRIFSNFDTKFKQKVIDRRLKSFKESEIIVISRSKYYFIFRVFFPLCIVGGIGAVMLTFFRAYSMSIYISAPLILVWLVFIWFHVVRKGLKYLYDFTIVDPHGIMTYKQRGILHSVLKEVPASRIRTIQFERNTLFGNIFEYGNIEIHTDFIENSHLGEDDESASVVGLTYVDSPYKIKGMITDLCFK